MNSSSRPCPFGTCPQSGCQSGTASGCCGPKGETGVTSEQETLTAEERRLLAFAGGVCTKVERLYDAALARVAELESHLRVQTAALADDLATERTHIAEAVAELEHVLSLPRRGEYVGPVMRALEILKGSSE